MQARRVYILFASFFVWAILIWARFFYWQIVLGDHLAQAESQQAVNLTYQVTPRGEIYATDEAPLVLNEARFDLYAWKPVLKNNPSELISQIEAYIIVKSEPDFTQAMDLGEKEEGEEIGSEEDKEKEEEIAFTWQEEALERLEDEEQNWVLLKKHLTQEEGEAIDSLGIKGLFLQEDYARFYPEASTSAHLLGFLGKDHSGNPKGYFGLEGFYNRQLQGQSRLIMEKQGWWNKIQDVFVSDNQERGRDLVLFLDRAVQYILEEELEEGVEKYGAVSGWAVVMDPYSGGVIGMASFPKYDPFYYYQFGQELFPNPIVAQHFEPGSIFKPLVVASVLEEKVIKPEDKCPICAGSVTVTDYTIETWNEEYYPDSTLKEILVHSDNVGMVWVGQSLGLEKMKDYLEKLNLGKKTGIDLEEEAFLKLKEGRKWYPIDLATASFGQGIALTPIQMISAFIPLANGGNWVKPRIVKKIRQEGGDLETLPESYQVFNLETTDLVKEMLVEAVDEGEAKWTRIPGFKVAGKTGTAQIPLKGQYDEEKTIASFIGFAPADHPRFVMLVSLSEPTSSPWGSETAAPLWFDITQRLFNYWSIQP